MGGYKTPRLLQGDSSIDRQKFIDIKKVTVELICNIHGPTHTRYVSN